MHNGNELFPGQHPDEEIIVFTRRHWIQLLASIFFVILAGLAYIVAVIVVLRATGIAFEGANRMVLFTVTGIVLLMLWLFLYVKFVDYYLDVWILTNERIVQIKQRSLFNRQIAEFDLSTVQDVSSQVRGVVGTFLNYGSILVQTAGTRELFSFRFIPDPTDIEKKILDAQASLEVRAKRELGEIVGAEAEELSQDRLGEIKKRFPDVS